MALDLLTTSRIADFERKYPNWSKVVDLYPSSNPLDSNDGDLLRECISKTVALANQVKDKEPISFAPLLFSEINRRCSSPVAAELQNAILQTVLQKSTPPTDLSIQQWQTGCAYMLINDMAKAERPLRDSVSNDSQSLLATLCLAECLRREKHYSECLTLCANLSKRIKSSNEQFASEYLAIIDAIHAQQFLDQGDAASALPLLVSAEDWYSKRLIFPDRTFVERPYLWSIFPSEKQLLENLLSAYTRLGRGPTSNGCTKRLKSTITKPATTKNSTREDTLVNEARHGYSLIKVSHEDVSKFLELCNTIDETAGTRNDQLLTMANTYNWRPNRRSEQMHRSVQA